MYGCVRGEPDESDGRPFPTPPKEPPKEYSPFPEEEKSCIELSGPIIPQYEAENCDNQCKPNEECKFRSTFEWGKRDVFGKFEHSKSCYSCEIICNVGEYRSGLCDDKCEEDEVCAESLSVSSHPAESCYKCAPTCKKKGLSSSETCDSKCKETEVCKKVERAYNTDVWADELEIWCYACTPSDKTVEPSNETCKKWSEWSEWRWETCKDGKQEGTRERSCLGEDGAPNQAIKPQVETTERTCVIPKVGFIIDGKKTDSFILGENKNIGMEVSSTEPMTFPIRIKLDVELTEKVGSYFLTYGASTQNAPKDYVSVKCQVSNKCVVNTDWGPALARHNKIGDFITVINSGPDDLIYYTFTQKFKVSEKTCTENWECGQWSACTNGQQTKTCTDSNNCGTTVNKPAESQSCTVCTPTWTCGEWNSWNNWNSCSESSTQARTRTRTCTDSNNCGTTTDKPSESESESQGCTYTPTQQKPEYSSHESSLGSNIENLDYNSASVSRDLSTTGGTFGYRILNIPAKNTITVCVTASGGSVGFFYYPQYHYGFDFTDTTPGCTDIYNKNDWANGVLVHLGDPTPANVNIQLTVTKK